MNERITYTLRRATRAKGFIKLIALRCWQPDSKQKT